MKHSKHYFRAGILIIGGFFVYLVLRSLMLPPSFGKYGHFRGDNVSEQMGKPVSFGAPESCAECHSNVATVHLDGKHKTVQCQNCHGPLSIHIQDGNFLELMPIDRSAKLCLRCHGELPSRPEGFPQIHEKKHLEKADKSQTVCLQCHKPHNPSLGGSR